MGQKLVQMREGELIGEKIDCLAKRLQSCQRQLPCFRKAADSFLWTIALTALPLFWETLITLMPCSARGGNGHNYRLFPSYLSLVTINVHFHDWKRAVKQDST